jgi:hypothetical protein
MAVTAGLTTRRLWEIIRGAALKHGRDVVALMVGVAKS